MNFSESFKQAFDSLRSNKLRSILTMLGIIMGVFSVITIVAVGNAAQNYINSEFQKLGANTIQIMYRSMTVNPNELLTMDDMETIKKVAPEIKNIATSIQRTGTLRMDTENKNAIVYGVTSQYKNFDPKDMDTGRYITDFDVSARSRVVIVSDKFALKYFKKTDILGKIIAFKSPWGSTTNLKVVGVTKSGSGLFEGLIDLENYATTIYMPISTLQEIYYNDKTIDSINVSVENKNQINTLSKKIIKALEMKHQTKDKYFAQSSDTIQGAFNTITNVLSGILLVIALITLVVGGIGIVNILLVSVTERIREIGIRKALGARRRDIVFQFIMESIIMTGFSGLLGILLGVIAGAAISSYLKIPRVVNLSIIILAFLGSVALGLIFGVYPAKKAADLDPIESLRYE